MLVNSFIFIGMRKGEELKTPCHASAAALRDDRLPNSRQIYLLNNFISLYIARMPYYRGVIYKFKYLKL